MTKLHPAWLDWPQTKTLIAAFSGEKNGLRFVGGAVRDALLGREVIDVDAATILLPDAVMALLKNAGITAIPTGIDHGTVTAVIDKKHFEITTLRSDTSCDGRHAHVAFGTDWEKDAERRDFTMNALYLSPSGELFDYFGGVIDAKAGRVRFIGEPAQRIAEDYLRILRFFRFHATYGKGDLDKSALAACSEAVPHIAQLSGERIQQEMLKLLAAPAPAATIRVMQERSILTAICSFAITSTEALAQLQAIETITPKKALPLTRLAALLLKTEIAPLAAVEKITARWKLSREMQKQVDILLTNFSHIGDNVAAQKKLLRHIGAAMFKQLVLLRWSLDHDVHKEKNTYTAMLQLADSWKIPIFPVKGADLAALGMQEGKAMGDMLRELESDWEQSDYQLTRDTLLAKVRR